MIRILISLITFLINKLRTPNKSVNILNDGSAPFTIYKKKDKLIDVISVVSNLQDYIVRYYQIDISEAEASKQSFVKEVTVNKNGLEQLKPELSDHNWIPYDGENVLFIQIAPKAHEDELTLLDKKGEIEEEIASELEKEQLGEWIASDIGPGGANILFTVHDIELALSTVLPLLAARHLAKSTIIARRVMTKQDDWFYEVLYPAHFTGQFNTM